MACSYHRWSRTSIRWDSRTSFCAECTPTASSGRQRCSRGLSNPSRAGGTSSLRVRYSRCWCKMFIPVFRCTVFASLQQCAVSDAFSVYTRTDCKRNQKEAHAYVYSICSTLLSECFLTWFAVGVGGLLYGLRLGWGLRVLG